MSKLILKMVDGGIITSTGLDSISININDNMLVYGEHSTPLDAIESSQLPLNCDKKFPEVFGYFTRLKTKPAKKPFSFECCDMGV